MAANGHTRRALMVSQVYTGTIDASDATALAGFRCQVLGEIRTASYEDSLGA